MAEREGPVEDGEHIYRSVRNDVDHYVIIDGMLRLCSPAFNDQKLQPSVDRAVFRANPADTRLHPDDGVVRLVVSAVRGVGRNTRTQGAALQYESDVVADPIGPDDHMGRNQNDAHALITITPADRNRFKKIKQALCLLAESEGWLVSPIGSPRNRRLAP